MKGCFFFFLSPAKTLIQTYKRLACCRNYHGSDLFSAFFFFSNPPPLHPPPSPAPISTLIRTDFQYMTAAAPPPPHNSIAVTKLPFCNNNGSNRYSITVSSAHRFFTYLCYIYTRKKWELHPGSASDPLFKAVCAAGPFIRTLHSCWTQLHHMPSANPILSISHPIPGSFSKQKGKKKKKRKRKTDSNSPVLSSAVADNCTFTSSSFWPRFSVIDEDLRS